MYIKTMTGWEHRDETYETVIVGNDWDAKYEFISYFSRKLNSITQTLYYDQGRQLILHPGDILHLYKYAEKENDFYFTIGAWIGWSRNLEDLSFDINLNMKGGVTHVVHFTRKGKGRKTIVTFTELPIEEYSKYGKENNE